jgi:hypothetical protein
MKKCSKSEREIINEGLIKKSSKDYDCPDISEIESKSNSCEDQIFNQQIMMEKFKKI